MTEPPPIPASPSEIKAARLLIEVSEDLGKPVSDFVRRLAAQRLPGVDTYPIDYQGTHR